MKAALYIPADLHLRGDEKLEEEWKKWMKQRGECGRALRSFQG